ncbi:hypothetical protein BH11ACT4_BH11ACT4_13110 [soil metagenome]
MSTPRIASTLTNRQSHPGAARATHTLPICPATGEARHRDRHQARQGAEALRRSLTGVEVSTWACPDCRGFHLEKTFPKVREFAASATQAPVFLTGKSRYVVFDLMNAAHGARGGCDEVAVLWSEMVRTLGITRADHVVVGSSRFAMRRLRGVIDGQNVKWVVGSDGADGVYRALNAATDLWSVVRGYDELVIVSGSGSFSSLASRAASFGLPVRVVTTATPMQSTTLSRGLAEVASVSTVVHLERLSTTAYAA